LFASFKKVCRCLCAFSCAASSIVRQVPYKLKWVSWNLLLVSRGRTFDLLFFQPESRKFRSWNLFVLQRQVRTVNYLLNTILLKRSQCFKILWLQNVSADGGEKGDDKWYWWLPPVDTQCRRKGGDADRPPLWTHRCEGSRSDWSSTASSLTAGTPTALRIVQYWSFLRSCEIELIISSHHVWRTSFGHRIEHSRHLFLGKVPMLVTIT
jgi:hypothetical protein